MRVCGRERQTEDQKRYEQKHGSAAGGNAGLFDDQFFDAEGSQRKVCLLQSLQTVPYGTGHWLDQQIL